MSLSDDTIEIVRRLALESGEREALALTPTERQLAQEYLSLYAQHQRLRVAAEVVSRCCTMDGCYDHTDAHHALTHVLAGLTGAEKLADQEAETHEVDPTDDDAANPATCCNCTLLGRPDAKLRSRRGSADPGQA